MRRRGFLALLGTAALAPFVPVPIAELAPVAEWVSVDPRTVAAFCDDCGTLWTGVRGSRLDHYCGADDTHITAVEPREYLLSDSRLAALKQKAKRVVSVGPDLPTGEP